MNINHKMYTDIFFFSTKITNKLGQSHIKVGLLLLITLENKSKQ